jgi:NDP-sugar pyrophosphorylase family protein
LSVLDHLQSLNGRVDQCSPGGLGTRVAGWAQLVPKEFQPVDGRPALLGLLDELVDAGAEQAVLVYHRYYEPFIGWAARRDRPLPGRRRPFRRAGTGPRTTAAVVRAAARPVPARSST